jgi:pyrroline-5-carboxylate reductase
VIIFLVKTIGIIGTGSLGQEVINALYIKGHKNIIATRHNKEKLELLNKQYPEITTSSNNCYAAKESDIIILAVKPKLIEEVCNEIKQYTNKKLIISLAAAKTIEQITSATNNKSTRISRVITGLYVAEQIAMCALSNNCTTDDREIIQYIFGQTAMERKEELLAHRTWIACATGLRPNAIDEEISELVKWGMNRQDANLIYAQDLESIAKRLRNGISGKEILNAVGGPESFTQGIANYLTEQHHYTHLRECVAKTIIACSKKK